jgi:signal transduction histidine kinase
MFRRRREEIIGCPLEQIFPPELARQFGEENRRVIETGAPLASEQVLELPDGRHDFHTVKFPLRDAAGRIEAVAGISLDITGRKRDEEALREAAERLQAVSRRLVELQEQERRHLARELHDEIGQALCAISVNLHAIKGLCDAATWPRIEESIQIADRATQQVRNLSLDLRPAMLDDLGLVATLRWLVDRQAQRAGLVAQFAARTSGAALPPEVAITCFRVAQEALANVLRHAQARHVRVELGQDDEAVDLVVRDDGVGFDPESARRRAARGESLGLLGVQERIALLGGRLVIESEPGHGTTLRIRLPVASPSSAEDSGRGN